MSYRDFKKKLESKREEQRTMNTLNNTLYGLEKKRDEYAEKAKSALKNGNNEQGNVYISLIKNAMFNIAQTRDMIANFTIAIDAREMQTVSGDFVKALNHVMKEVYKSSKSIRIASSQKLFVKALYKQNYSASELQQFLKENNLAFQSSVNSLSDISDDDVKAVLLNEIKKDNENLDDMVDRLEEAFSGNATKQQTDEAQPITVTPVPEDSKPVGKVSVDPQPQPATHSVNGEQSVDKADMAERDGGNSQENGNVSKVENSQINVAGAALRPQRLKDYLGQPNAVATLEPPIKTSLLMEKALPHVLLCGSYGQGKTTLAKIIAKEMGGNFVEVNSRIKPRDMVRILRSLKKGDIVFVDEVHQLSSEVVETILYPAMEDFELHITESNSVKTSSKTEKIAPFTLIAATTETGKLLKPFYSKFPIKVTLAEYTPEVIAAIIKNSFKVFGLKISDELCFMIAKRSRLSPRTANEYVTGIRDFVVIQETERRNISGRGALSGSNAVAALNIEVKEEDIKTYFATKGIDENGLDNEQRKILRILIENYNGGPVGQDTIAKALNVANNRVDEEYEPYLVKRGLIGIGPNGRFVTDAGFKYMGKTRRPSMNDVAKANSPSQNDKDDGTVQETDEDLPVVECTVGEFDSVAAQRFSALFSGEGVPTDKSLDEIFPDVVKSYDSSAPNRCVLKVSGREIYCDSKLERRFISYLFKKGCIKDAKGEALELEYSSGSMSGKRYFPDFVVKLHDDTIVVIEMKNLSSIGYHLNIDKYDALVAFCVANGYRYAEIAKDFEDNRYISAEQIKALPVNEQLKAFISNKIESAGYCSAEDLGQIKYDIKDLICILLNDRSLKNIDRTGSRPQIIPAE